MDHRALIRSLPPQQRADLTRKSNRQGLLHLAGHWGLIVVLGGLIAARVPYWPVLMLPQGILIVFLFTLLHETSHRTVFATAWLNKAVAWICGFLIILPPEWFRQFHFDHHRYTQDPEKDPELLTPKPATLGQYLIHVTGLPVWFGHLKTVLRNASGRDAGHFIPGPDRGKIAWEARIMVLLYAAIAAASLAAGSAVPVFIWLAPLLLGQPFLRLYLLAEHGGCPYGPDMLENSRTTHTTWLVRKLAWNMPFHAEHHSLPGVPFHRLPQFHALIKEHLKVTEDGYIRFHRHFTEGLGR